MEKLINAADAFKARRNESSDYAFSGSNWFPMDRNLLRNWKLSSGCRYVYMMLHSFNDHELPTSEDLVSLLEMSKRRLRRLLDELETAGLISIERERVGRTYRRIIHLERPFSPDPDGPGERHSDDPYGPFEVKGSGVPKGSLKVSSKVPNGSPEISSRVPNGSAEQNESLVPQGIERSIYSSLKRGIKEKNIKPPYTPRKGEIEVEDSQVSKISKVDRSPLDALLFHAVNLFVFVTYQECGSDGRAPWGGQGGNLDQLMLQSGCASRLSLLEASYPPAAITLARKLGPRLFTASRRKDFSRPFWRSEARNVLDKLGKSRWGMDLADVFSLPEINFYDLVDRFTQSRNTPLAAGGNQ